MREILFRGKRLDNGEWVEGDLWAGKSVLVFARDGFPGGPSWNEVDPSTVGQFTGLLDKHGERIFEGDIVVIQSGTVFEMAGRVVFDDGTFWLVDPNDTYECLWYKPHEMEIIGDIHDNPDPLEVTPDE